MDRRISALKIRVKSPTLSRDFKHFLIEWIKIHPSTLAFPRLCPTVTKANSQKFKPLAGDVVQLAHSRP